MAYLSNLYGKVLRLTESVFASVLLFYFIVWERKSLAACFCFCEVWCAINGAERIRLVAVLRTRCLMVFYFYMHAHSVFVHPPTGSSGSNLTYKHPFQFWSQGWQGYRTELLVQALLEDGQPTEQQQGEKSSVLPFLNRFCCSFTHAQSTASLCRRPQHHPSLDISSGISSSKSSLLRLVQCAWRCWKKSHNNKTDVTCAITLLSIPDIHPWKKGARENASDGVSLLLTWQRFSYQKCCRNSSNHQKYPKNLLKLQGMAKQHCLWRFNSIPSLCTPSLYVRGCCSPNVHPIFVPPSEPLPSSACSLSHSAPCLSS